MATGCSARPLRAAARVPRGLRPVVLQLVDARQMRERAAGPPSSRAAATASRRGRRGRRGCSRAPVRSSRVAVARWMPGRSTRCWCTRMARSTSPRRGTGCEREMRVDGLVVVRGETEEHLERSLRLVVKQETQAFEIPLARRSRRRRYSAYAPWRPAHGERAREHHPERVHGLSRRSPTAGTGSTCLGQPQRIAQPAAFGQQARNPVGPPQRAGEQPAANVISSATPDDTVSGPGRNRSRNAAG